MNFSALIKWSLNDHSHLPWRKKRTLYRTLVSEIMLQQTTVGTVLNHFERFLKEFPTIHKLAAASEEEVTMAWKGLGYYRRARNLRKACGDISEIYNGKIPLNIEKLVAINGIGDYTANALVGIGANKKALAIDANLERVLARLYAIEDKKGPKLHKEIKRRFEAGELLPKIEKLGTRDLHEALMDLGRTFCRSAKAECLVCPMNTSCLAFEQGKQQTLPIQDEKKKAVSHELHLVRVFVKNRGKYLGYQKGKKEWLSGQIEFPTFIVKTDDPKIAQYPKWKGKVPAKLQTLKMGITKYKITNYIYPMTMAEFKKNFGPDDRYEWFKADPSVVNYATSVLKILDIVQ